MILNPTPVSSSKFSFKNDTFVAEVSDLGSFNLGPVYDDAADAGFSIVSKRAGKSVVFAFVSEDRNDGEIVGWKFVAVTPGFKHLKALIIND